MVSPLSYCGHLLSGTSHDRCLCCGEDVGDSDAETIAIQLKNREKNCMWCGDDFNLSEEEIVHILEDNTTIDEFATILNDASNACRAAIKDGQMFLDIETDGMDTVQEKCEKNKVAAFEKSKKRAIESYFGVNIDKEKFDPGYVDAQGCPRDRIADAVPYEKMRADKLPHRILKFINGNSDCTGADIKRRVRFSRISRFKRLPDSPISRLYTTGLIDCESKFIGFVDMTAMAHNRVSGYFGKMPRFSRKYSITCLGKGVLSEFENGKKEVLL